MVASTFEYRRFTPSGMGGIIKHKGRIMVSFDIGGAEREPARASALEKLGFRFGDRGTHTSRTIMLAELELLLDGLSPAAIREDYRTAVIEENLLGKRSTANRKLSFQRLSELYALDPRVPLFRILRHLWEQDSQARPLLALQCALARDPLLRASAAAILEARHGQVLGTPELDAALQQTLTGRLNPSILNKVARNAGSSWTQGGYTSGRAKKLRVQPHVAPANLAYAAVLGTFQGARGELLLDTPWFAMLGKSRPELLALAHTASMRGWLTYKNLGAVIDLQAAPLLTLEEQELCL